MIDYATYCQIRSLHQNEKLTPSQIAHKLQLDKKTVRYWLGHPYHEHKRPNRSSKLDPYKLRIKAWLEEHNFTAQQILPRAKRIPQIEASHARSCLGNSTQRPSRGLASVLGRSADRNASRSLPTRTT